MKLDNSLNLNDNINININIDSLDHLPMTLQLMVDKQVGQVVIKTFMEGLNERKLDIDVPLYKISGIRDNNIHHNQIEEFIFNKGDKCIITNGNVLSRLIDSGISYKGTNTVSETSGVYEIGEIVNGGDIITLFIDPYMGWNDNKIYLFDSFHYNLEMPDNINSGSIDIKYSYNIIGLEIIYVFSEGDELCQEYNRVMDDRMVMIRDRDISDIIK